MEAAAVFMCAGIFWRIRVRNGVRIILDIHDSHDILENPRKIHAAEWVFGWILTAEWLFHYKIQARARVLGWIL